MLNLYKPHLTQFGRLHLISGKETPYGMLFPLLGRHVWLVIAPGRKSPAHTRAQVAWSATFDPLVVKSERVEMVESINRRQAEMKIHGGPCDEASFVWPESQDMEDMLRVIPVPAPLVIQIDDDGRAARAEWREEQAREYRKMAARHASRQQFFAGHGYDNPKLEIEHKLYDQNRARERQEYADELTHLLTQIDLGIR